jgi:hypothetical protein
LGAISELLNGTGVNAVGRRNDIFEKPGISSFWFPGWGLVGSHSVLLRGLFLPDLRSRPVSAGSALRCKPAEALGNSPKDVSAQKVGYDIASYDPKTDHLRFIEVKGRVDGADSLMITRQEVITSLHEPDKFILAIVQVDWRNVERTWRPEAAA